MAGRKINIPETGAGGSGASTDTSLEARVARLERIIDHLELTQPHLMPQPESSPAPVVEDEEQETTS